MKILLLFGYNKSLLSEFYQKFPLEDFCFNPQALDELIDKLEPYINNKGLKSDYFKTMYQKTFEKDVIYNQIKGFF